MEIVLLVALGLIVIFLGTITFLLWKIWCCIGKKKDNNNSSSLHSDEEDDDELFPSAKELAMRTGYASPALLQRKLRVGYARAARLIDMLEDAGVVGERDGAKPRPVLK